MGARSRDIEETSGLIHKFMTAREEKLSRAIHWYRKSLGEADPLDRFTYIWTALETLNSLMKKMHPGEVEGAKCKKCGHARMVEGTAALKKFFVVDLSDESLYSRARRLRQELLHGHGELDKIMEEASEIVCPFSIALRTAVCVVNGIKPEIIGYDIDPDEAEDVMVVVYMKLGPFAIDEADPHFKEPDAELDITVEERGGELIFHPVVTMPFFDSGIGIASIGFDLVGRTGYPFKKASITFQNRKPEETK